MVACITILIAGSRDGGRDLGASIGSVISGPVAPNSPPGPQLPLHYLCRLLSPVVSVRPSPHVILPFPIHFTIQSGLQRLHESKSAPICSHQPTDSPSKTQEQALYYCKHTPPCSVRLRTHPFQTFTSSLEDSICYSVSTCERLPSSTVPGIRSSSSLQDHRCPQVLYQSLNPRRRCLPALPSTGSAGLIQMIQMYAQHQ
jgi:hypothetical protein